MKPTRPRPLQSERGAVLVFVAVGMVALLAFSALVIDHGVAWVARAEAQTAADAGALSGAISLAFVDPTDQPLARTAAISAAQQNLVWTQPPDVLPTDVTFPPCPPKAGPPGATCVKVDVHRNQARLNPLPMFFGQMVGLTQQGVRATATARILEGDTATCVKPWAIPDKWNDLRDNPQDNTWTIDDQFEKYVPNGNNAGQIMSPADSYTPPVGQSCGTGFCLPADYGLELTLKAGNPQQSIAPGFFFPVRINPNEQGGQNYRDNIGQCDPTPIGPGTVLQIEPGNMIGPTVQGVQNLINQDYYADWNTSANNGKGGVVGGCMAAGTCLTSPRLVPVPVFDPDYYDSGRASGAANAQIRITNVLGFFLDRIQGNDVIGYFTFYPTLGWTNSTHSGPSSFVKTVVLVR